VSSRTMGDAPRRDQRRLVRGHVHSERHCVYIEHLALQSRPAVFGEDADKFRPERHLDEQGELSAGPAETNQTGHVSFGFGRRICVGKELAADSLFIDIARMLWALNFERAQDENGKEVPLDLDTLVDAGMIV